MIYFEQKNVGNFGQAMQYRQVFFRLHCYTSNYTTKFEWRTEMSEVHHVPNVIDVLLMSIIADISKNCHSFSIHLKFCDLEDCTL